MKWFLEENYPLVSKNIDFGDGVVFLGSCFSQNIFEIGKRQGLRFQNTHHGTIFHPLVIARLLIDCIHENSVNRVFQRDNLYYSWDASTKFVAENEEHILALENQLRTQLLDNLKNAKYLFLTFGTAKGYTSKDGLLVANCHKMPASDFESNVTPLIELISTYKTIVDDLLKINPNLEIVLTVSPVRHSKDGLIENNRSKARLLLLCEELSSLDQVSYFPAYEIMIDQLRDYRFYSADLVHPSSEAIDYIWNVFQDVYLSEETKQLGNSVLKFRNYFEHLPIKKETEREASIRDQKKFELTNFLKKHPKIIWE